MAVGIDVVDVARFGRILDRRPGLARAAVHHRPSGTCRWRRSRPASPRRRRWPRRWARPTGWPGTTARCCATGPAGPRCCCAARWPPRRREQGIDRWHLSLSHDAGIASAMVVAETGPDTGPEPGSAAVRAAHAVAVVREAEGALMATVPPGTLMQRAATGLARDLRAAARVGATAPGCCCSWAAGTTAGTPCTPGPGWPGAGPGSTPCCSASGCTRRGLGALLRAGGRAVPAGDEATALSLVARADLVVDGIVGIGGSGALRAGGGGRWPLLPRGPGGWPSTCPAGWTPTRGAWPGRPSRPTSR